VPAADSLLWIVTVLGSRFQNVRVPTTVYEPLDG
jgi:hypothetical protein